MFIVHLSYYYASRFLTACSSLSECMKTADYLSSHIITLTARPTSFFPCIFDRVKYSGKNCWGKKSNISHYPGFNYHWQTPCPEISSTPVPTESRSKRKKCLLLSLKPSGDKPWSELHLSASVWAGSCPRKDSAMAVTHMKHLFLVQLLSYRFFVLKTSQ